MQKSVSEELRIFCLHEPLWKVITCPKMVMGFENWLELLLDLERRNCIDFGWNQEKSEKCGLKVRSRPLPLIKGPLLSTNDYNHLFLSKIHFWPKIEREMALNPHHLTSFKIWSSTLFYATLLDWLSPPRKSAVEWLILWVNFKAIFQTHLIIIMTVLAIIMNICVVFNNLRPQWGHLTYHFETY